MSLRISDGWIVAGLLCFATTACDGRAPVENNAAGPIGHAAPQAVPTDDGKADCAIGQDGGWAHDCLVERSDGPDGTVLTLRHPDGGFRRFRIVKDGRGLVPADGAEQAKLAILGNHHIELTVGTDRYRLPATIAATGK